MLPYPPSLDEMSRRIEATLGAWIQERGGTVKQIANAAHIWEEIPGDALTGFNPKLLFWFESEKAKGGLDRANKLGRVIRSWRVVLIRGHGWKNLVKGESEEQPESFLAALSSLRDVIRCQSDVTETPPVDYESLESLPNIAPGKASNIFVDSFQIRFMTENDIGLVDTSTTI